MRIFYFILALVFTTSLGTNLNAQQRNCGAMEHLEHQLSVEPSRARIMNEIEQHTEEFINEEGVVAERAVITIPTVIHVVYRTNAENISDAQILSQIQVLNDDFRRLNADANNFWSQAADVEIEFCMASVDPNGNPTNGITRTQTSVNGFGTDDAMKYASQGGKDAWPTGDYLNMWVCNIGGGILGYAQFPGSGAAATDGVVCGPTFFGTTGTAQAPFNLGRTTTHEVGHWLNLRHIWGDGNCNQDDFVSDTPSSDAANYGCASGHTSCGTRDMVENYMDYSDDACMNLFTQGQKTRMRALFTSGGFRASLVNSNGCNSVSAPTCNDGIQNGDETGVDCGGSSCNACPSNCTENEVVVTINPDNYGSETTWTVKNAAGQTVASGGPYTDGDNSAKVETLCLSNGCYDFQINDGYGDGICCSYGNGSYSVTGAAGTLASGASFTSSETTNFCVGAAAPTCDDGIQNGDETGVDCGGSNCVPCITCDDGIQNGDETGVDCGGSNCPSCPEPVCTDITFSLTFDNYASETSWQITNSAGAVIGSGSNYTQNNETINLTGCLDADCYTLTMMDSYGDGICCSYGNGSFSITDGAGNVLVSGSSFGSSTSEQFCLGGGARLAQETEERATEAWEITNLYPNPVQDQLNIDYQATEGGDVQITVFDVLGRVVIQKTQAFLAGQNHLQLDVNTLEAGYHLVKIQKGENQFTQKFVKN